MRVAIAVLAVVLLVYPAVADVQQQGAGETPPDNDPNIYPNEVAAPAMEAEDAGQAWEPLYGSYEDPASVQCGGRESCEAYKANATAEAVDGA
jgi:hypothetical protein